MPFWSKSEEDFLRECCGANIAVKDFAPLLNRSVFSVRMKRHSMGLSPPGVKYMTRQRGEASVHEIKLIVADHFQIQVEEMTSPRRDRKVARPRQVAMFFAREIACKSYPCIGRMFGGRDHSTAIHARQQIQRLCAEKASFAQEVEELRENIINPQLNDSSGDFPAFVQNQAGA